VPLCQDRGTESMGRGVVAGTSLTVALDTPSARILADQASIINDLQFVMDSCKRLLDELARPQEDRDGVVPQALWSSALVAYARCFSEDRRSGLAVDDVQNLPLQGAVMKYHTWVIGECGKLTAPPADPYEAVTIGAALAPPGQKKAPGGRHRGLHYQPGPDRCHRRAAARWPGVRTGQADRAESGETAARSPHRRPAAGPRQPV
jgi:hypothetical protein